MNIEKRWEHLNKQQRIEWKFEKFFAKFDRLKDVDPRSFIRHFTNRRFIDGFQKTIKFVMNEILFEFYITIGKKRKLLKPIFIIGLPHSGTTISMKLLSIHPDIANKSELNTYWHPENYLDLKNCDHVKTAKDCTTKEIKRLNGRFCFENWKLGNKKRFMNKNPNNTVAIEFIKGCFPDSFIVHVIRDGRAVVNSLLHGLPDDIETYDRYKDPYNRINPFPGVRPPNWRKLLDKDPVLQHAKQWNACIEYVLERRDSLAPNYIELYYEKLCECPKKYISEIWKFIGLEKKDDILDKIPNKLQNQNYKYKIMLKEKSILEMTKIMEKNLKKLGYYLKTRNS